MSPRETKDELVGKLLLTVREVIAADQAKDPRLLRPLRLDLALGRLAIALLRYDEIVPLAATPPFAACCEIAASGRVCDHFGDALIEKITALRAEGEPVSVAIGYALEAIEAQLAPRPVEPVTQAREAREALEAIAQTLSVPVVASSRHLCVLVCEAIMALFEQEPAPAPSAAVRALMNVRMLVASWPKRFDPEMTEHLLRFCREGGVVGSPMRNTDSEGQT